MQEEVDQKTIALAIKTGKLTGQALQAAMKKYLEARKKGKARLPHGQQSLRKLKRDGSALSNIEITEANIGLFKPCAKKYDIDFSIRTEIPQKNILWRAASGDRKNNERTMQLETSEHNRGRGVP